MSYYDVVSASAPMLWWRMDRLSGSNFAVPNDGTGGAHLSGVSSSVKDANFQVITGSSTSSVAYNQWTGNSGAFYLAKNGAFSIQTARIHDFDMFNPFDPVNATSTWTAEWWVRSPSPASNHYVVHWHWGGTDANTGMSVTSKSVSGWLAGQVIGVGYSFFSGNTNYTYDFLFYEDIWRGISMIDGDWYHFILFGSASAWPNNAMSLKLVVNGRQGVTQTSNAGTWVTAQGTASNYFFTQYSGGSRIQVGATNITNYGSFSGQQCVISDFALYNRLLSSSEVDDHWLATRTMWSGTISEPNPVYTVHIPARTVSVPSTGTGGGNDPRATKTNPGVN